MIVDDERYCRDNLKLMLKEYCPAVEEIRCAPGAAQARELLSSFEPDLLFLDIHMPRESGIDFLQKLEKQPFKVVFTTAHNEYALQALKLHAFDYLEKPISIDELQKTVADAKASAKSVDSSPSFDDLQRMVREMYTREETSDRISVAMQKGIEIIEIREIIRLAAAESYTELYLQGGRRLLSSKNIKVYEDLLCEKGFFRCHKSHIINARHHLKGYSRVDGHSALMRNGDEVPISRRKLQDFLNLVQ